MRTRRVLLLGLTLLVALAGCSSGSGAGASSATTVPATAPARSSSAPPATTPATGQPVASGPATSAPQPPPDDAPMTGGRYLFGPIGDQASVMLAATGPDGWQSGSPSWFMEGPEPVASAAPTGIGVAFFTANGLYSDPCRWDWQGSGQADVGDVKVGPSVDDMVAALRANTFYTSTAPKPVTIDGYAGKELEIQLPDTPSTKCDKDDPNDSGGNEFVFAGPGLYAQGRANRWHMYVLDVDGTRLISAILSYAKTPKTDLDLARHVVETMDINP